MASEKPFVERFTNPGAAKPGKRCGTDKFDRVEHPSHAHGKKSYERPTSGLIAPGGGVNGHPSPKSVQRPVFTPHKKVTTRVEAGLVVGSPDRLQQSVERQRVVDGSPKGKKQNVEVLPGQRSPKHISSFMSDTESSARRKEKVAAERIAFPAKPRQANPWEKPGLNPTLAINIHANHGVSMNAILHDSNDTEISPTEIAALRSTGAAGSCGACIPVFKDLSPPGKRTGSPENGAGIDHVAAHIFERPAPGAPAVPALTLDKLGKKQHIIQEKKSAQWTNRSNNAMGPRKRLHPKFSARRIGGTWMSAQPSPRKPSGRVVIQNARGKSLHINFGSKAAVATQGITDDNHNSGSRERAPSPPKMTKKFLVEHRCTSSDNVFARANHKSARLEDGSASLSASPSRSSFGASGDSLEMSSSPKLGGSQLSVGSGRGAEAPIGASARSIENPRIGKKFHGVQKPGSSLQGCFDIAPLNKKALEFRGVVSPFGDHSNQSPTKKGEASPARIGWKGPQ